MSSSRLARWAAQDRGPRPAVVLGQWTSGLSYVRSLHARGIPTLLLTDRGWLGAPSRFELTLELPGIVDEPDLWLETLLAVAERSSRRPVLLVAFDHAVLFAGARAAELELHYDFLIPPFETSRAIVDKHHQYELAAAAGIPIPRTIFPESGEAAVELAGDLSFPCLLKPFVGYNVAAHFGGRKNQVVADAATLGSEFDRLAAAGVPCLVQEIIPGGDDAFYGYLGFWGRAGDEVAWITKQKLRQEPALFGDGSYQRTVDVPPVAELSRRFLKALGYVGVASVEFKQDVRDGSYRLIEVNPRAVSGNELAVAAGVDLPYISYAYLVNGAPPAWEQRWGVHWINELLDLKTLLRESATRRAAMQEWIRSLRQAEAFALGARGDPGPLLATFGSVAYGNVSRRLRLEARRLRSGAAGSERPEPAHVPSARPGD